MEVGRSGLIFSGRKSVEGSKGGKRRQIHLFHELLAKSLDFYRIGFKTRENYQHDPDWLSGSECDF